MENSDVNITPTMLRDYLSRLHGQGRLGEPHTRGECMECLRDGVSLWVYGDFVICARCVVRRHFAGAKAADRSACPDA